MAIISPHIYTLNPKAGPLEAVASNAARASLRDLGLAPASPKYILGVGVDSYKQEHIGDLFLPPDDLSEVLQAKINEISSRSSDLYEGVNSALIERMRPRHTDNSNNRNAAHSLVPFNILLFYSDGKTSEPVHGVLNENVLIPPNTLEGLTVAHSIPITNGSSFGESMAFSPLLTQNISDYISKMEKLVLMYKG